MKKPTSSVSKGSDPLSSAGVLPAGSPKVSAKPGPVASGPPTFILSDAEKCKCGRYESDTIHDFAAEGNHNFTPAPATACACSCPKHGRTGCTCPCAIHDKPATAGPVLTVEEYDKTLRKAEKAAFDFGSATNANDHRHTIRLLNHDAALRAEVERLRQDRNAKERQLFAAEAEVERLRKDLTLREAELDEATGPGSVWNTITPDGRCANCGATGDEGAARDRYKSALAGQSELLNETQARADAAEAEVSRLEQEKAAAQYEGDLLRAEVERLRQDRNAKERQLFAAEAEAERLKRENTALYVMCKDRNANIEHLEERLARGVLARIFDEGRLIEQRDEARTEAERLTKAATALYFAAYWHADRPVDESALWAELRDAARIEPGQTARVLGHDRRPK